jgi:hypothetical protein
MTGVMRRLLGILLNVATLLSALLFVGAVILWVRSYVVRDAVLLRDIWYQPTGIDVGQLHERDWSLFSSEGRLGVEFLHAHGGDVRGYVRGALPSREFNLSRRPSTEWDRSYPRFARRRVVNGPAVTDVWIVQAPLGALALLLALVPAIRLRRRAIRRRRRLIEAPCCSGCGYDLRATPDRCPECGTIPTAQQARLPGPYPRTTPGHSAGSASDQAPPRMLREQLPNQKGQEPRDS